MRHKPNIPLWAKAANFILRHTFLPSLYLAFAGSGMMIAWFISPLILIPLADYFIGWTFVRESFTAAIAVGALGGLAWGRRAIKNA